MKHRLLFPILLTSGMSFSSVCAQEILQLDKIEVQDTVQTLEERKENSIAKRIIRGEELTQYGDQNALEILKRTPGVTIPEGKTKKGAPGKGYTVVLIDGEEASTGSKRSPNPLEQISPDMIERIEIMTNGSAEYTAEAMGGIVNIVLKKPKSKGATKAKLTVGSYKDRPLATLYAQREGKIDTFSYIVNATVTDNKKTDTENIDTYTASAQHEVRDDKSHDKMLNVTTKLIYTPSSKEKYTYDGTLSLRNTQTDTDDSTSASTNTVRKNTDKANDVMIWSKLGGEYHLSGSELLEWKLKFHQNNEKGENSSEEITPTPSLATQNDTTLLRFYGASTDYSVAKDDHFIKTGIELKHVYQDNEVRLNTGTVSVSELTLSENRGAVYIQDEISSGDNLVITPGIRYENVSRDFGTTSKIDYVAPSFHLLYKLTSNDNIRASIAKTVRLPRLNDLAATLVSSLYQNDIHHPDHIGNPDLKEEQALSYELRGEHFFGENGIVSIGGFYRNITDKIETTTTFDSGSGRYLARPYNAGNGQLWGSEFELKKSLDALAEGLGIFANATYQDSSITANGVTRPIKQTSNFLYNVGVDHTLKAYRLTYGAAYRYVGGYDDPIDENGFSESQKGYGVFDLYATKRLNSTFKLGLNLKNITSNTIASTSKYYDTSGTLIETQIDKEHSSPQILLSLEGRW
ncbi:TonB-dependent receptor [Sulfuricurvum sp.]|uniref:TonB-dependent receptor plug domain-containing protein n=1 Tax=Sulfuricurvum sp. TaxID=2025608 RepID=UPI00262315E8|nr:TonB-dependent receptor [Sulfuricurvum sp.]MDD2266928.1 TonB-dependent receptor [Sulfuricurvum sp.]MDD2783626.1 TonB-dependent receptor [Sulfuricurvum sp.]